MKKEELLSIGLSEEQANQVFAMNGKDVENAKEKLKAEISSLNNQLTEAKNTISTLEAAKGDTEALQEELDKYKQADEARQKAEQEAAAHASLVERFGKVKGDREFSSKFAEAGLLDEFNKAINDPANTGKGDKELFDALTKDAAGLFKNPQQETVKVPGVTSPGEKVEPAKMLTFF